MKNKKILIIIGIVAILLVIVVAFCLIFKKNKLVQVNFDTNGGTEIKSVEIKKGESITLPSTIKEGYKFLGWYIGDIIVSNSTKFTANTTIFAKWLDESIKTFKVTFDTDGGSNVSSLIIECGKQIKFGPNPTKTGYEFVSWVDEQDTPILDGALLECSDITLKANWKQDEVVETKEETKKETKTKTETKVEPKKDNVKKTVYSCSEGTLNGDKCLIEKEPTLKCPNETYEFAEKCITLTYNAKQNPTKTCSSTTVVVDNNGHTEEVKGEYFEEGQDYCYFKVVTDPYEQNSNNCKSRGHKWNASNNKCYFDKGEANEFINISCQDNYQYLTTTEANNLRANSNISGCFPYTSKVPYCNDELTLTDNKCVKTISATVTYE